MWLKCPSCKQQMSATQTASLSATTEEEAHEEISIAFCTICDTMVTVQEGKEPIVASIAETIVVASASYPYLCRYIFLKWLDNMIVTKARIDWDCRILNAISQGMSE